MGPQAFLCTQSGPSAHQPAEGIIQHTDEALWLMSLLWGQALWVAASEKQELFSLTAQQNLLGVFSGRN